MGSLDITKVKENSKKKKRLNKITGVGKKAKIILYLRFIFIFKGHVFITVLSVSEKDITLFGKEKHITHLLH